MLIHHVAVGSPNVRRLGDFLERALDLVLEREHLDANNQLRSLWYRAGQARIMIEHTNAERPSVTGVGAGPFLIALSIAANEANNWRTRLATQGIPIESFTDYSLYFRDPDGNRWALSHYPQPCHVPESC